MARYTQMPPGGSASRSQTMVKVSAILAIPLIFSVFFFWRLGFPVLPQQFNDVTASDRGTSQVRAIKNFLVTRASVSYYSYDSKASDVISSSTRGSLVQPFSGTESSEICHDAVHTENSSTCSYPFDAGDEM